MSWWEVNSSEEKSKNENDFDYSRKVKFDEIIYKKAAEFKRITDSELSENFQYRIVTTKSFNAISVLKYIAENYEIKELWIAIYRMNIDAVNFIVDFSKKTEIEIKIILSDFFRENKKYERWCNDLAGYSKSVENLHVAFANNHAKVFCCLTKCGKHIVFEGSGNLSDNARIEQYLFENNKETYFFHLKWMEDVFNGKLQ